MGIVHYPHCYNPKNKPEIIRVWEETRSTKCPIVGSSVKEKIYTGKFVEYNFINKNGKKKHVPELCLLITWIKEEIL